MNTILATIHLEPSTRAIPLAAACLKAMVETHETELRNYYLGQNAAEIAADLLDASPEAVGFSVYLWNRPLVIRTMELLREQRPGLILLAGGPEVTADPRSFLNASPTDVAMEGEGEPIIAPLLDALAAQAPLPRERGIWTGDYTPEGPAFGPEFDALPSPLLTGALDLEQNPGLLWELSRGCPFACDFCFESKGARRIRTLGPERIEKELRMIRDAEIQQVFVLDPTFNADKERVLRIIELIRRYTPHTYYYFEVRSEFIDHETAEAFATIPCTLQIGLQSSVPEVLQRVNRNLKPRDFQEKTAILSHWGVSFGLDLIYGLPGDDLAGFRASLDYTLALQPNHLDLFPLAVLPGTVLYDNAARLGVEALREDPYTVLRTDRMDEGAMEEARILAEETDLLYNRGKAVEWFLRVCTETALSPAALIDQWRKGRAERAVPLDDAALRDEIIRFLRELYHRKGLSREFRIIRDLIRFRGVQDFLDEQQESAEEPTAGIVLEEGMRFALHPSAKVESFAMAPQILMEGLAAGAENLADYLEEEDAPWVFWSRDWELCCEPLAPDRAALLAELASPCGLPALLTGGRREESLREALVEGILEGYIQAFPRD